MILLVTATDYHVYRRELDEMHGLRHRVFKQRLGWNVASENDRERDGYDDLDPTYLLALDEAGRVVGTWRFLPTTGPYMLRDTFPQLLEGRPPPSDLAVWEGSRFAVERSTSKVGGLASIGAVASELLCAVVETCLTAGVRQLITVYDHRMARLLHRMGCPPRRQSAACHVGQGAAMAGYFDITAELLESIRHAAGGSAKHLSLPHPSQIRTSVRTSSFGVSHVRRYSQLHRLIAHNERGTPRFAPPASVSRNRST